MDFHLKITIDLGDRFYAFLERAVVALEQPAVVNNFNGERVQPKAEAVNEQPINRAETLDEVNAALTEDKVKRTRVARVKQEKSIADLGAEKDAADAAKLIIEKAPVINLGIPTSQPEVSAGLNLDDLLGGGAAAPVDIVSMDDMKALAVKLVQLPPPNNKRADLAVILKEFDVPQVQHITPEQSRAFYNRLLQLLPTS